MATPYGIERAANQAAICVKKLLIEMLLANELGDVIVEVGHSDLQPIKRVKRRAGVIKVSRGHEYPIE